MKDIEDLGPNWECECGNDKVSSEWSEDVTNMQIFRCSECGKKAAKRIW